MKPSEPKQKEYQKPDYQKPDYWKQKYCRLICYRLKNRLDEVYDNDIQHHHHIKPKSIYGQNDYLVLLTVFEHCVAHWYLSKYFKYKNDKDSFRKMNVAFMSLFRQCGFELRNVEYYKMFNQRKSMLEKNIDNMLHETLDSYPQHQTASDSFKPKQPVS